MLICKKKFQTCPIKKENNNTIYIRDENIKYSLTRKLRFHVYRKNTFRLTSRDIDEKVYVFN